MRDFDDNEFPLPYLVTFRCYGTWLHGDERGSFRRKHKSFGTISIEPQPGLQRLETAQLLHAPMSLDSKQRAVVQKTISDVCLNRRYILRAVNVRTNHIHVVVTANLKPEPILNSFKSYSTRALRASKLISSSLKPWARHGSTIYLWKERHVEKAVEYVLFC